jgi:hypothetical protein
VRKNSVDPRAASGFASAVDAYERGRPSYPADDIAELPWLAAFEALVKPHRQAAGRFAAEPDQWKPALRESRLFTPLSHAEVAHVHRISADDFVALVASWSWITNLPDQQRADVLAQVRALVANDPQVTLRYRTELYWTRLIA